MNDLFLHSTINFVLFFVGKFLSFVFVFIQLIELWLGSLAVVFKSFFFVSNFNGLFLFEYSLFPLCVFSVLHSENKHAYCSTSSALFNDFDFFFFIFPFLIHRHVCWFLAQMRKKNYKITAFCRPIKFSVNTKGVNNADHFIWWTKDGNKMENHHNSFFQCYLSWERKTKWRKTWFFSISIFAFFFLRSIILMWTDVRIKFSHCRPVCIFSACCIV